VIVLDTHSWVWWASDSGELSKPARKAIDDAVAADRALVSSISVWEVAMLAARDRLRLSMPIGEWVVQAESIQGLRFAPVTNPIALRSVQLPGRLHDDPADRIIIATALSHGAAVVTKDEKIRRYEHVRAIW
jgi:PIN domain nuclease of toxin-antitoxin system